MTKKVFFHVSKCHKSKKKELRPNALKQELDQKPQKSTEAQIIAVCSLNVLERLSLFKNVLGKS